MLYLQHFGLREAPFGLTPDTGFFFSCRAAQEALNTFLRTGVVQQYCTDSCNTD